MRFFELLTVVITLLQREGRVSYRALKLEFALDEEHLDALRDELIYAKRLATDEDGRVLVWAGSRRSAAGATLAPATADFYIPTALVPATLPPLITEQTITPNDPSGPLGDGQYTPAAALPDDRRSDIHLPAAVRSVPEAERRQLTVMFCDLVGSTHLSERLDPEDLREVVRAYQETAAQVIQRYDGYIAQYLGDGLLVYFGYPQAHENDVQRAVWTGLGIVEALGQLNTRLAREKAVQLAIRIGIHTGSVVVGAIGGGGRHEHLALGETPNIGPIPTSTLLANSETRDTNAAQGEARGCIGRDSVRQATTRTSCIAGAMSPGCRGVLASPLERDRRLPHARTPWERGPSIPARAA